jgi:glycosyltransferase 2 family protein
MHGLAGIAAGAWSSLAGVSLGVLAVAVALHLAKLAAEARAWHGIVRHSHAGYDVSFRTTFGAFVGAIGANAILPARVGETLRVGVVRRALPGSSVITIAATIVLETGIEAAFGVAVVVAVLVGGGSVASGGVTGTLAAIATQPVALGVLGLVLGTLATAAIAFRHHVRSVASRMADGFAIVRSPRAFAIGVMSWKLVAWSLRLACVYAFLVAFHVPAAPWTAVVVVGAQNVAASLPLLPGNAGTQQAAIGLALAGTAGAASVLGFGVGMQAATAAADVVVGAAALALVASRADLLAALGTLRPRRRARPVRVGT